MDDFGINPKTGLPYKTPPNQRLAVKTYRIRNPKKFITQPDFGTNPKTGLPYKTPPDKRLKNDQWRRANPERYQEMQAKHARSPKVCVRRNELNRLRREKVIAGYGGCCSCCGETQYEFLSIDHVKGGGHQERSSGIYGQALINRIILQNFPDTFRLLCHNCNFAKGVYGYCPHQYANQEIMA